jgi:hypothetical protein
MVLEYFSFSGHYLQDQDLSHLLLILTEMLIPIPAGSLMKVGTFGGHVHQGVLGVTKAYIGMMAANITKALIGTIPIATVTLGKFGPMVRAHEHRENAGHDKPSGLSGFPFGNYTRKLALRLRMMQYSELQEMVAKSLTGYPFIWSNWSSKTKSWTHDHCYICKRGISDVIGNDSLHSGYIILDRKDLLLKSGHQLQDSCRVEVVNGQEWCLGDWPWTWMCEDCFSYFLPRFAYLVASRSLEEMQT